MHFLSHYSELGPGLLPQALGSARKSLILLTDVSNFVNGQKTILLAIEESICVPSRTSLICYCYVANTKVKEGYIPRLRLQPGVYAGEGLVKNKNGKAYFKIINITSESVSLAMPELELLDYNFTPKYLLDGTDTNLLPEELKESKNAEDWKEDKKLAVQGTIKSHEYNKKLFDKNRKEYEFNVGNLYNIHCHVYLKNAPMNDVDIDILLACGKSNSTDQLSFMRKPAYARVAHASPRLAEGKLVVDEEAFRVSGRNSQSSEWDSAWEVAIVPAASLPLNFE
ncbi:hypothetical protein M0804_014836 [Polistes exclamans]|nr:hypothetical protein M0804_014836 [Polistes exclamans]